MGSPVGPGREIIPAIWQTHKAGGTRGFFYGISEGDNSCHLANPQGRRDKGFSCGTGNGVNSCHLVNPQDGTDKGFSCMTRKGDNSCHLENPQDGRDKVFSCRTGTVGEGGYMIVEVTEP